MTRVLWSRRAALGALAVAPLAAHSQEVKIDPLAQYLWVARPVVIFADSDRDPRVELQLEQFERDRAELEVRDVVVILDTEPGPSRSDTTPLRARFRPHGFNVLLIDKDGQVKMRRPGVVSASDLMRLIDRLPSRQEEMGSR